MPNEVKVTTVRFPIEIWVLLQRLTKHMSMSKVAVITLALRTLAKQEGVSSDEE